MATFYKCEACNEAFLELGSTPCEPKGLALLKHDATGDGIHAPAISEEDGMVKVQTGEGCKPTYIVVETSFGDVVCDMAGQAEPNVKLPLKREEVEAAYAWCPEHGLFKSADDNWRPDFETNDVACSPEFPQGCVNPSEN